MQQTAPVNCKVKTQWTLQLLQLLFRDQPFEGSQQKTFLVPRQLMASSHCCAVSLTRHFVLLQQQVCSDSDAALMKLYLLYVQINT